MKSFMPVNLIGAIFLCGSFVSAQTADEVIAKYLKAIGGKEVLSMITSIYMESKADIMGMESIQKTTILNGKGYRMDMDIMGSIMTTCFNDNSGWSINPMMGSGSAEDMPQAMYISGRDQIYIGSPFTIYAEKGYKAELLGSEAVGNANTFKVKLTAPDNTSTVYFFDKETGYILKSVSQGDMQGQTIENVTIFSDYKQVNGYTLPHTVTINIGGMIEFTSTVTKVEINKPVDEAFFAKP